MENVKISNIWHLPLHLVKKETKRDSKLEPNKDLNATAVVRVKAPPAVTSRFPIHLVVVIDVSCSSGREEAPPPANVPLRLDLLKQALKFIMMQLHDGDHLTIVFNNDNNVNFEISKDTKKDAENTVDAEVDGTLFKPGLKEASKIFDKKGVDDNKYLCFIILLSDGLDKSEFKWSDGNSDANEAAVRGFMAKYPVHTFGLGKHHDPSALLYIANQSKGTYSSITENVSTMLIEALAVCLGGITNIVAVDTVITIKADHCADEKMAKTTTMITELEEYGSILQRKVNNASCDVAIGILYAGEVKDLVVHFQVKIGHFNEGTTNYAPLGAQGQYKATLGSELKCIELLMPTFSVYARNTISPKSEQPLLPFPMVEQQMVRIKVLRLVDRFQKDYQELKKNAEEPGSKEGGKLAVDTIAGNMLMKQWGKFKGKKTWKNAQEVGLDVERIGNDVESMVSGLKRGLGMGCVYSWVSSHQMQRATITGLPVTAFLTPAMKEMVQKTQIKFEEETPFSAAGNMDPSVPPGDVCLCKRAIELLGLFSKIEPETLHALCGQISR